ncbi:protein of unknown function [Shewanella benthica]|uniref:Uncharacterized protein n=1 Tax=Shewanella benthica TaxID=43661 RepID=A0A330LVQ7_9GAMM|nr:protein of unknown function [Shewanella benthica]
MQIRLSVHTDYLIERKSKNIRVCLDDVLLFKAIVINKVASINGSVAQLVRAHP